MLLNDVSYLKNQLSEAERKAEEMEKKYENVISGYKNKISEMFYTQNDLIEQIKGYKAKMEALKLTTTNLSENHNEVLLESATKMSENSKLQHRIHQLESINAKYERDLVLEKEKMKDFKQNMNDFVKNYRELQFQLDTVCSLKRQIFN